jgi:uncharacterized damage-inducible protein DinB
MKRSAFILATLFAVPAFAQSTAAPSNPAVSGLQMTWGIMSGYFTRAAEQMPESDYSYKPVATVRSFGELIGHVAGAQNMFCAAALGDSQKSEDDIEKSAKTKAALVAALKASNEYCAKAYQMSDAATAGMIKLFGQDRSKAFALSLNAAHVGEHYGNLVTYLRMKGMVPPSSQGQ